MTDDTGSHFYDEFASHYHLIFEDWEASMSRQAAAISSILERESGSGRVLSVLDCACGIGTQSLGLAKLGYHVTTSDLSAGAVRRARAEAVARELNVPFYAADVRRGPAFYSDSDQRRIIFQVWDWADERRYTFHLYITRKTPSGWNNFHGVSVYRAVLRDEITAILASSGFANIRWLLPDESGFYQPVVIGTAAG